MSRRRGAVRSALATAFGFAVVTVLVTAVAACTVGGEPTPVEAPDLSGQAVDTGVFPAGATRVPAPALPGVIADVTGRPLHGEADPARCTPAAVSVDGAAASSGPAGTGTAATLTSLIVSVSESLDQAESLLHRCGTYRTGTAGVATSTIRTEILPPPTASAGVDTLALRRTTTTGGEINPLVTSTTTLIGQRDGARVYVEYRASGGAAMPADAGTALDALFQASVAAAWP